MEELKEFINTILCEEFYRINKKYYDDIFSHIEKCDDSFRIECRKIRYKTLYKKMHDNNHRIDLRIRKIDNGIKVPYMFKGLFWLIRPHIPKSITSISLPLSRINIKDLEDFKNLDTLITDEYVDYDELKMIKEYTNIKTIYAQVYCYYNDWIKGIAYTNNLLFYKDIKLINNNNHSRNDLLTIRPSTKNIKEIEDTIKKFDVKELNRIDIIRYDNVKINILVEGNRTILVIFSKDYNYAFKYYNMLKKLHINVDSVVISLDYYDEDDCEKKINYCELDFDKLDKFSKKVNLLVTYNGCFFRRDPYEEYRSLVEAVKYYKDLINTYPLSALEKLTFAYDIMKSFLYNEGKHLNDSRKAHKVISTGNIVCAGYVDLLNEILYELDPNIKSGELDIVYYKNDKTRIIPNHVRNIVRIHDDKYNVHGFYLLDVTWDSFHPSYYDVYEGYDALGLYRYFLIPITSYDRFFEDETIANLFSGDLFLLNMKHITNEIIDEYICDLEKNKTYSSIYSHSFEETFCNDEESDIELLKEFKSRRISLHEFLTLIRNVRACEGYSGEILDEEVDRIERINEEFFKEKNVKRFKRLK